MFYVDINIQHNNINFGVKLKTLSVLETTTQRIFSDNGINGIKEVTLSLRKSPFKATGQKGYKHLAEITGEKIIQKYPQIAKVTQSIKEFIEQKPMLKMLTKP